MSSERPVAADGLDVNETDDGLIIYQESTDRVHHLNPSAAVIFQLCDGKRDVAAISVAVGEVFNQPEPPESETRACLDELRLEQLVI